MKPTSTLTPFIQSFFLFCLILHNVTTTNAFTSPCLSRKFNHDDTLLLYHHVKDESRRKSLSQILSHVPVIGTWNPFCPARAMTPEDASNSYNQYATNYDILDGGKVAAALGISDARAKLFQCARGNVLEIGVGTGLNLSCYNVGQGGVTSLTLVDISKGMLSQAKLRVHQLGLESHLPIRFVQADATSQLTELFGKNKFDTVIDSFSLCVMGNEGAKRCLGQMAEVVKESKDEGRILLLENTRSSNPFVGYYQDMTAWTAADFGGKGCLYNQNVREMIEQTEKLKLLREESFAASFFRSFVCEKST